jgi:hypothetical protein
LEALNGYMGAILGWFIYAATIPRAMLMWASIEERSPLSDGLLMQSYGDGKVTLMPFLMRFGKGS